MGWMWEKLRELWMQSTCMYDTLKTKTRKERKIDVSNPIYPTPESKCCLSRVLVVLHSIIDSWHSTYFADFDFCSVKSRLLSKSNQTCDMCWISTCLCYLTHMPKHSHPSVTDVSSWMLRNLFSYILWIDFHGSSCFMDLKIICVSSCCITLFL